MCKSSRLPVFPKIKYCPVMNSTSPEELTSIAVLRFSRTSCIFVKLKVMTIPPCSPGLRAEVVANCLAEVELWCHPCSTESETR